MGEQVQIVPVKVAGDLRIGDLSAALAAGWKDFRAYPAFGLFFAAIYVAAGMMMLVVGGAVGALMALAFYSITVMSLPMLVDREVDFLTAIIVSLAAMRANGFVLVVWAVLMSIALFAAMVPMFLGLLVVLPVLGHATWHLYRRVVLAA